MSKTILKSGFVLERKEIKNERKLESYALQISSYRCIRYNDTDTILIRLKPNNGELSSNQYDNVANAIDFLAYKMNSAKYSKGERQIKYLNEAIYGSLKLMKSTLSEVQYKKYLRILNTQIRDNGLNPYIKSTSDFLAQNKTIVY